MIVHSYYEFNCLCGSVVRSESNSTTCGSCGRELVVEWPADESKEIENPRQAED